VQEDALLIVTEHAVVVARPKNGRVIREMSLADMRRIESTMVEVRCTHVSP
jgi:hypothetical protein